MIGSKLKQLAGTGLLVVGLGVGMMPSLQAQPAKKASPAAELEKQFVTVEQPDAERTKNEFLALLEHYPPTLRRVFRQDPTLMTQDQYLAPYPALVNFLKIHPEIVLNPAFYLNGLATNGNDRPEDRDSRVMDFWRGMLGNLMVFAGFAMAATFLTWLIRTFVDYRRWNRLSRVQQEVHTKLLDRFSNNEEVMAYITSPAGTKFLQSAPISLDTGAKTVGAPLNRILLSLQAGVVLVAAGGGLMIASGRVGDDASLPLQIMGILAVALGVGFAVSAAASYLLSHRLGLLDLPAVAKRQNEPSEGQQ